MSVESMTVFLKATVTWTITLDKLLKRERAGGGSPGGKVVECL